MAEKNKRKKGRYLLLYKKSGKIKSEAYTFSVREVHMSGQHNNKQSSKKKGS